MSKDKFFELVTTLIKNTPNDSELGNLVRKSMLVTENFETDMEVSEILEKINYKKK